MVCERCGGLKMFDHFSGATHSSIWACDGFRCINCGAVTYGPAPALPRAGRAHPPDSADRPASSPE